MNNWTFEHDDHSPFGNDDDIYQTEYYSLLITISFFLLGLFGNIFLLIGNSFVLRNSFDGEKRTFENFLIEISCFDIIILLYHLIDSIIRYRTSLITEKETMTGLINISTVSCKLLTYIIRISTLMSHWLIVLLLFNRLVLIHSKFHRLITIVNAKYAVFALLFLFTLFNVPPIESMSSNEPLIIVSNSTHNITFQHHCLMNAEMVDLQASIYSTVVYINVFFYTGIGLILPTIVTCICSILILSKGVHLWNKLRLHNSHRENISIQSKSPLVEYLRTYNAAFTLGIVFVLISIPSKCLRLIILFSSHHTENDSSISFSHQLLFQAHARMQTVGHAFELALSSYKCFVLICTHHRFRCGLKYLFTFSRRHILIEQRRSTIESYYEHKRNHTRQSQDSVPFESFYRHLKNQDFDSTLNICRPGVAAGLYSHRSSFKTRSSVSSRRTKEDEISL